MGKTIFDFEDGSWTWADLADALTTRYNVVDREEMILSMMRSDKELASCIGEQLLYWVAKNVSVTKDILNQKE